MQAVDHASHPKFWPTSLQQEVANGLKAAIIEAGLGPSWIAAMRAAIEIERVTILERMAACSPHEPAGAAEFYTLKGRLSECGRWLARFSGGDGDDSSVLGIGWAFKTVREGRDTWQG